MQFKTVRGNHTGEFQKAVNRGGRGAWFNHFHYEIQCDPTTEGAGCWWSSDPTRACFSFLRPDIEIGLQRGRDEVFERGIRLCSMSFTILFARYHDIDTTPAAIHSRVRDCVLDHILPLTTPITPPRTEWLTSDVIALARGVRADAETHRYLILSDALRDAGCEDQLIHDHLQVCPDHGSSCWVVEMILDQTRPAGLV